ncbi:hypothetical protein BDF20DRAFT_458006 [Mycotypha africana]|uniref:uncharacterized protein n=1 Tax=Mycotypha africana TaxID=64632 RepID=UPI0023017BB8|nr:uncharacterized protein BDF20DRAFT_458006 [Mycotypha africana]KAI8982215.1 hypothetical protein BDF20DRAFT_458006 [Mycotypha africana]
MMNCWSRFKQHLSFNYNYKEEDLCNSKLFRIDTEPFRIMSEELEKSHFYNDSLMGVADFDIVSSLKVGLKPHNNDKYSRMLLHTWSLRLNKIDATNVKVLSVMHIRLQKISKILLTLSASSNSIKGYRNNGTLSSSAHPIISECLKDWSDGSTFNLSAIYKDETALTKLYTDKTLIEEDASTELQIVKQQFKHHYQQLKDRQHDVLKMHGANISKIKRCIKYLYQVRKDLCIHNYYISSQFILLRDWMGKIAATASTLTDGKDEAQAFLTFDKPHDDHPVGLLFENDLQLQQLHRQWQQAYRKGINSCANFQRQVQIILTQSLLKLDSSISNSRRQESLKCTICLSMYSEPITLSSCQHTFCRDCLQRMFCSACYQYRQKLLNRLSMRLSHYMYYNNNRTLSMPLINCHCSCIDTRTGDIIPLYQREKNRTRCPLCRSSFKPEDCILDTNLAKYIQRHHLREHENNDTLSLQNKMKRETQSLAKDNKEKVEARNSYNTNKVSNQLLGVLTRY